MFRQNIFRLVYVVFVLAGVCGAGLFAQEQAAAGVALQWLRTGGNAMQRGDLETAESSFRHAINVAPDLSDAHLGLGLTELKKGDLNAAVQSLTRASELNPKLHGVHLFLGIAQSQLGDSAAAAASFRTAVAVQPTDTEALTWLGIAEMGAGHPEEATGPLDQAAALKPKDPEVLYYRARAHMLVAEAAYHQLSELDPDSALVHRGMAESFDIAGQPEKAIAEYEAAVKKEPNNADLYDALGQADLKMSRVDSARDAFQQELRLNPHSALALYNLGKMDVERGKPADGVTMLRKAEAAHAAASPTDFYLGLGLAELGQNEEAAQWLEKSLANGPSPFVEQGAWYQLARVYQKLNRRADAQHALDQLKQKLDEAQRQKESTAKKAAGATPLPDAASSTKQP